MYYVYILLLSNGKLYKGYTKDLQERLTFHRRGKVKSTKNYLPVSLIHYECYLKQSDALRREKFLKTTEGRRLLRSQIRDILEEKISMLS
jgi:putative endonuclease